MYCCSKVTRALTIVLLSSFLGACSTGNGLDIIAAGLSTTQSAVPSSEVEILASSEVEIETEDVSGTDQAQPTATVEEAAVSPEVVEVAAAQPSPDPELTVSAYAEPGLPPSLASTSFEDSGAAAGVQANSSELHALIKQYSSLYEVPERLVHRVVKRESNYDPAARNKIYWGLMQIRHDTATTMGYRGPAGGLLDAETNLKYAVKYLRGAYLTANRNEDKAVSFYARGYYYDAKRKGLLKVTGLRP